MDGGAVEDGELAEKLDISEEDISTDAENIRDGRPGISIACRPGQDFNVFKLAEEFEHLLESDG